MKIRENKEKKVLLSVLGVAILLAAVIGISFAAYNVTFDSGNANSISTGTIMVSYTEPTNAISILDAMPLEDSEGMKLTGTNNTFDFTVSTKASNALTIPYTISLTKVAGNTLLDSEVKVYLTKDGQEVLAPTKVSTLVANARENSVTLYTTSDVFTTTGQEAKTTNYVLRMWVDKEVTVDATNTKTYKAKVNVDSAVTPVA
jgi:hypothetical protein